MGNRKALRVILDTNLWVSFLITKNYIKLDSLLFEKQIKLIFSEELFSEFIDVTNRPKFKKYFSHSDIKLLLNALEIYGEIVVVTSKTNYCRDIKDNFLVNLAIDGKADYLLTGDKDLLELKKIGKTRIITIDKFLK